MRANVKDPQWRVRLHDLKLFGILVKEITVGKEYVHVAVWVQMTNLVVAARHARSSLQMHEARPCKTWQNGGSSVAT